MIWKKEILFSVGLFFFLTTIIFWPSFLNGQILFPGNYLQAWFEPYKSTNSSNETILIAHKPVASDDFRHIYPFKVLAVDMLKKFQLPLWNPYNGAGEPLLATVNSGLIDPFNVLFFIMPYLVAWNSYLFLQLLLISLFTYLYCRSLRWHPLSATFATVSFALSGIVIARLSMGVYGLGIATLPLFLWIIESYLINSTTKRLFLIPFVMFALITSTHPQTAMYIVIFSFLYLVIRAFRQKRQMIRLILIPTIFFILGIMLSSIQILLTVKLLHYGNLNPETSSYVQQFLVPWYHIVSLFIPNYFGNGSTYNFWGPVNYIQTVVAVGLIPCFFAYLFIFHSKQTSIKFFYLGTFLITCLLAIDSPISRFLLSLPIPILSTDPPSRIFLLTTFSVAIMGGGGLEMILKNEWSLIQTVKRSLHFIGWVILLVGVTAYLYKTVPVCNREVIKNCYEIAFRNTLLELVVFLGGFCLFTGASIVRRKKQIIFAGIIIVIFLVGFYNAEKFLPFSPASTVLPDTSFFQKLQRIKSDGRVFGLGEATITTDLATFFKIYDPQYYHPLYIRRYGELTAYANYGIYNYNVLRSDVIIRNDLKLNPPEGQRRERLLQLLNVTGLLYNSSERPMFPSDRPIILDKNNYLLKNNTLPRAFVVTNVQTETDSTTILKTLFSSQFNPAKEAIIEQHIPFQSSSKPLQSHITMTSLQENSVSIQTNTNQPGFLVLLDNYYPGWNAYVDGKQTDVYRTDYTFRGMLLPKGNHTVQFIYQPLSVTIGLFISMGTLIILVACFFFSPKLFKRGKN